MARDGSLVCSDDPNVIAEACENCCTPFPPGCIYMSGDHPLNKIRAITWEDDEGNISTVLFQVDLFTRLRSIPRTNSFANWAGVTTVDGE